MQNFRITGHGFSDCLSRTRRAFHIAAISPRNVTWAILDRRKRNYASQPPPEYFSEVSPRDLLLEHDFYTPQTAKTSQITKEVNWSKEQCQIFDLVASQPPKFRNLVVDAKAGSGKTTTLIECLNHIPSHSRVLLLAYNTSIARFLATKLSSLTRKDVFVTSSTFHSIGYKAWREATNMASNQVALRDHKLFYLLKDQMLAHDEPMFRRYYLRATRLVEKAKLHGMAPRNSPYTSLLDDCDDAWMALAFRYNLEPSNKDWDTMISICRDLLSKSIHAGGGGVFGSDLPTAHFRRNPWPHVPALGLENNQWTMDFDDMIYLPVIHSVPFETYDYVMVDEAQDMSEIRREMVDKCRCINGKLLVFGDRKQSIYGFTGAGSEYLKELMQASVLPNTPIPVVQPEPDPIPEDIITIEESIEVVEHDAEPEDEEVRLLLQTQPPSFSLASEMISSSKQNIDQLAPILLQRTLTAHEKQGISSGQVYCFERTKVVRWIDGMEWRTIKTSKDGDDSLSVAVTPADVTEPAKLVRYIFHLTRDERPFRVIFYADPHLHRLWSKVESHARLPEPGIKEPPPETYFGRCKTLSDVDGLITAACLGTLPLLKRSLNYSERLGIRSGSIFMWDGEVDRHVGESWSDGREWTVLQTNSHGFRMERQVDGDLIRQTVAEPKDRFRMIGYVSRRDYLNKRDALPRPEHDTQLASLELQNFQRVPMEEAGQDVLVVQADHILSRKRRAIVKEMDPLERTITLGLSTCYRCAISVIREAQRYVSNIYSSNHATVGIVEDVGYFPDVKELDDGIDTMIISRFTRDVLNLAFKFTAHWIPVVVQGRRVGSSANVVLLVKEVLEAFGLEASDKQWTEQLKESTVTMDDFCQWLYRWKRMQVEQVFSIDSDEASLSHSPETLDRYDTLMTLIRNPPSYWKDEGTTFATVGELVTELMKVFPPTKDQDVLSNILLTTMHQSRGLERTRVYVLNAAYRHEILWNPTKTATQLRHFGRRGTIEPWEVEEELNLLYISTTRAKKQLYYANWDFKEEGERWWYFVGRKTSAKTGLGFEHRRTPYGDVVPWSGEIISSQFAVEYLEQTLDVERLLHAMQHPV
jgi:superfamily I DNA/RNA helicase